MTQRNSNSRALRQLAVGLLGELNQELDLYDVNSEDLATSLVRQWITYDGKAMLFVRDELVRAKLVRSPPGQLAVSSQRDRSNWTRSLREDWRIDADELPEIFAQLNCGQSIEVVNQDGLPIRVWVNPQEETVSVESLADESALPRPKRDLQKIAHDSLEDQLGDDFATEELAALAASIVKQWRNFEGHACLFLERGAQLCMQFEEKSDGGCVVRAGRRKVDLEGFLASLGIAPDDLPEVVARLNLGQPVEFRDRDGESALLFHDPKARRINVSKSDPIR